MTQPNRSLANPATPATELNADIRARDRCSVGVRDHSDGTGASLETSLTETGFAYGCVDWFMYIRASNPARC